MAAFNADDDPPIIGIGGRANGNDNSAGPGVAISSDFWDDFDDDGESDAVFFATANGPPGRNIDSSGAGPTAQKNDDDYGMVAMSYDDARAPSAAMSGKNGRPASPLISESTFDLKDGDVREIEKHLVYLRNESSSYQTVAKTCLVVVQTVVDKFPASSSMQYPVSLDSLRIESSPILHIQRFHSLVSHILSSLKVCLSTHAVAACRILAAKTLATVARSSYARLHFDEKIFSVRLPSSTANRMKDECGNGTAYALVIAALNQNDSVSCAALESLGRLTVDTQWDGLAAETRCITQCCMPRTSTSERGSGQKWRLDQSLITKEIQSKAWENILFPRMQALLQRTYTSDYQMALAIPVVAAALVHALVEGPETKPSRRAIQTSRTSNAKRGWRETDMEGLVSDFVWGLLLKESTDRGLQRAMALACLRLSAALPSAIWMVPACRHAAIILHKHIDEDLSALQCSESFSVGEDAADNIAGTVALLLISLRGIPINERAPGISAALRATMLSVPQEIPLPIDESADETKPGRTGLLTEMVVLILLDDESIWTRVEEPTHNSGAPSPSPSELLLSVLQSVPPELPQSSMDELMWVFCSVALQVKRRGETLPTRTSSWRTYSLLLLEFFAASYHKADSNICSPYKAPSQLVYNRLLISALGDCNVFPPASLSISDKMCDDESDDTDTVIGGPGNQSSGLSPSFSRLMEKLMSLRESPVVSITQTGRHNIESSFIQTQFTATLVDSWIGKCISNHDRRLSNADEITVGPALITVVQSTLSNLFNDHLGRDDPATVDVVARLVQVLLGCIETVVYLSVCLDCVEGNGSQNSQIIPLASQILQELGSDKGDGGHGSLLRHRVGIDAINAMNRLNVWISNQPSQSKHEDIASAVQVSPLIKRVELKGLASIVNKSTDVRPALFRHRARLTSQARISLVSSAKNPGTRLLYPRNPLRLPNLLSHSIVERDGLPLKLPEEGGDQYHVTTLTSCSDPVVLTLAHELHDTERSDLSDARSLAITLRLHNATPLAVKNIRLGINISQDSTSCFTSATYENEIAGGDHVTWEVVISSWEIGNLKLQAFVTFMGVQIESCTSKWVSLTDGDRTLPEDYDDDYDESADVSIECRPAFISTINYSLRPCPIVFFKGDRKSGDADTFVSQWNHLNCERVFTLVAHDKSIDSKLGRVTLNGTGCALTAPGGKRLLFNLTRDGGSPTVHMAIRSNSSSLLDSLIGTEQSVDNFLQFLFDDRLHLVKEDFGAQKMTSGHDFPSMTMTRPQTDGVMM